jgi:hypothetical protein
LLACDRFWAGIGRGAIRLGLPSGRSTEWILKLLLRVTRWRPLICQHLLEHNDNVKYYNDAIPAGPSCRGEFLMHAHQTIAPSLWC